MTKKILDLKMPETPDEKAMMAYRHSLVRYVCIKEEQAQKTKEELLILWTDYFKPDHLKTFPNLHETFWRAAKLCSAAKVEVSQEKATELLHAVKDIHEIFWKTKGIEVPFMHG